jgi:hypothetical protein
MLINDLRARILRGGARCNDGFWLFARRKCYAFATGIRHHCDITGATFAVTCGRLFLTAANSSSLSAGRDLNGRSSMRRAQHPDPLRSLDTLP